jgi:3-isopropylmalate/(R)-2-methylmalate dehydratase small subunit
VSTSFADIFKGNALKNGLLPIEVDADAHAELVAAPWQSVSIDLATQTMTLPSGRAVTFPIDPFAKRCLLDGVDQLGYLLGFEDRIAAYEAGH